MGDLIIKVDNLTKVFSAGNVAVNSISFEVLRHQVFGILGPNGSGKTTILRMLATVLEPSNGSIVIDGLDYIRDQQTIRSSIGYVPQRDALYPNLTAWENIDIFFSAYPYNGDRKKRIEKILKKVDLWDSRNIFVRRLSGGMTKRLSIAIAIVHDPRVIFFDEVTMGLDPVARSNIWGLVNKLKKHSAIVMTTHYMDEAEQLCDNLIIISGGSIIANGKPEKITHNFKAKNLHEVIVMVVKGGNV
ncbi:MAG: ABC transporter ATP-binding protein [Patescibacteria group bacterium]